MTDKQFEVLSIEFGEMFIRDNVEDKKYFCDSAGDFWDIHLLLNEQAERIQALEANCQHYKTELAGHQIHIAKLEVKIQALEAIETRLKAVIDTYTAHLADLERRHAHAPALNDVFLESIDECEKVKAMLVQIKGEHK